MNRFSPMLLATMMALCPGSAATAQTRPGHDDSFPTACREPGEVPDAAQKHTGMAGMKDHQSPAMEGMEKMYRDMTQGMMKSDADVAFICGMIAHHQGAIDMARVELEHGDDPWAKKLAEAIITAQTAEIADMAKWLETHAR